MTRKLIPCVHDQDPEYCGDCILARVRDNLRAMDAMDKEPPKVHPGMLRTVKP